MKAIRLAEILDRLEVTRGCTVYVHSSLNWMKDVSVSAPEIVSELLEYMGPDSDIVMPSCPERRYFAGYLQSGAIFDVRRTPTAMGLVAEVFRRGKEVRRSLHPCFSVAAKGPSAEFFTSEHHLDPNPFGAQSPPRRLIERNAVLLGLGVSFNTNALIHVVDDELSRHAPQHVYDPVIYEGHVIDPSGASHTIPTMLPKQEVIDKICPSRVFQRSGFPPNLIRSLKLGESIFFSVQASVFMRRALEIASEDKALGCVPCWLEDVSLENAAGRRT